MNIFAIPPPPAKLIANIEPMADFSTLPAAVELDRITKTFGKVKAVDQLSIKIAAGEIVALLGPNGAGKTTTIDMALGLVAPDSGQAKIFGMSPREAVKRGLVGVVQQSDSLLGELSVEKLLQLVAATQLNPQPVGAVLEAAGITYLRKRLAQKCSGGEKQRVRLAMALLSDPMLLFLDEPTTGLDVSARQDFWRFIETQSSLGRSIVFATHYLAEAENYAKRTIILSNGKVIADDETAALRQANASTTLVCDYTGDQALADQVLQTAASQQLDDPWRIQLTENQITVSGQNLDDAARAVLQLPGAANLTITRSSLEDAYTALLDNDSEEVSK